MNEPPMIDLAKYGTTDLTKLPEGIASRLAELGERLDPEGAVLSTRRKARQIIADHRHIEGVVYLNAAKVEIATPSFFHELLKTWPEARLAGANPEVQASFDVASSTSRSSPQPEEPSA